MRIDEVGDALIRALDKASQGTISDIQRYCQKNNYEAHITVEANPDEDDGEMMLFVQAFDGDRTDLFAKAQLTGKAQELGWHLFLTERCDAARRGVNNANAKLDKMDLAIRDEDEPVVNTDLFSALKASLEGQAN